MTVGKMDVADLTRKAADARARYFADPPLPDYERQHILAVWQACVYELRRRHLRANGVDLWKDGRLFNRWLTADEREQALYLAHEAGTPVTVVRMHFGSLEDDKLEEVEQMP